MARLSRTHGFSTLETLVVVALVGVVSAISLPMATRALGDVRLRGDARAVAHSVALAKMRAASGFTRARMFVNLDADGFFIQVWNRDLETWETEGGTVDLSAGVRFGFGALDTPPPETQVAIAQSSPCQDDEGEDIGNTACIVFNSRGIPIDNAGTPTGNNALYITDGLGVYATTLTATPLVRLWWSPQHTAAWVRQ
jgi:type II secretory pathway pseudopilin PulG